LYLNMFSIVFCVRKAVFNCVSLKMLVTCLTSLPQYVKVAHFAFCLGSSCVLWLLPGIEPQFLGRPAP
jgi:hypothetical protein